jgi:hypothetical protein
VNNTIFFTYEQMTGRLDASDRQARLFVDFHSNSLYLIDSKKTYGKVQEWLNWHAWRACVPSGYRGFESHPFRKAEWL